LIGLPTADCGSTLDSTFTDQADSVRAAGAKLLSDTAWSEAPNALMNIATNDQSAQVRAEARMSLSHWVDYSPKVIETIKYASLHDESEETRDLAAQLIAASMVKIQP
jgi:hypothetical protein